MEAEQLYRLSASSYWKPDALMNWESAIALQAKEEDLILTVHCKT